MLPAAILGTLAISLTWVRAHLVSVRMSMTGVTWGPAREVVTVLAVSHPVDYRASSRLLELGEELPHRLARIRPARIGVGAGLVPA